VSLFAKASDLIIVAHPRSDALQSTFKILGAHLWMIQAEG